MTDRLYYHDSFLYQFDAQVTETFERESRHAVVLDRTAFYPTSGGQVNDTGALTVGETQVQVFDVVDEEDGRILHITDAPVAVGTSVQGSVDSVRRRDHMQQHSGQHVLSAAFLQLFHMPTVSFHMGEESCTIDLETVGLSPQQAERAERLANEVIAEDRPVSIRFVSLEEARSLGLRKLPPKQAGELRIIDMKDFDVTACGGTHVRATGQIGAILVRKTEKVKQGIRVEFVCGLRAVEAARQDFATLTEAAGLFSSHIRDVPQQVRKLLEESKAAGKAQHKTLEELAELHAHRLLQQTTSSPRIITAVFPEREAVFIKLLAQKLTAAGGDVVALVAAAGGQPTFVFAQSPGMRFNMGQQMKELMTQLGGRGGGSADMAQGGSSSAGAEAAHLESVLQQVASRL